MTNETIESYWYKFLAGLTDDYAYRKRGYVAESFGDNPESADKLGDLILRGIKTGTCSALWEWEVKGDPIPVPGLLSIVLDGERRPLCIIETTVVFVCRFNIVDEEFARAEGEGDLSLQYWREAHTQFFSRTLPEIGKEFSEKMPLVCERFRVIYK